MKIKKYLDKNNFLLFNNECELLKELRDGFGGVNDEDIKIIQNKLKKRA